MNRYVIVSGLPASGKSTIARGLATQGPLPLFDKDPLLEAMYSPGVPRDAAERRSLSHRADQQLEEVVRNSPGAIVVSWWRHPRSAADSGTPTGWLHRLHGTLVEVYCECAPDLAVARFCERKRHPGHMDGRWSRASLAAQLATAAQLGPLNIGALVKVDSERPVDFAVLWKNVESRFGDRGA
jgi:glucokinase